MSRNRKNATRRFVAGFIIGALLVMFSLPVFAGILAVLTVSALLRRRK